MLKYYKLKSKIIFNILLPIAKKLNIYIIKFKIINIRK